MPATLSQEWQRLTALVRARPLLADSLLAVAMYVVGNSLLAVLPATMRPPSLSDALAWSAAGVIPIAIRRRWPWPAVLLTSAHAVVTVALGLPSEGIAMLLLTYTVAAHLPLSRSSLAAVVIWVPGIVYAIVTDSYAVSTLNPATFVIFNTMSAAVAYLVGRVTFNRRRYVAALVERAHTAEQNQRTLATHAVEEERHRIARELHDMVAHHVSVMGVLATGSRRMLRKDPDAADEALATIESTGRTALREMRRLLDVLRTEPEPPDPLAPQPGLGGLTWLVDQVREAGLRVSLRNDVGPLEPGVGLTVYRVVQEALTNVIKHGGSGATAEVRLASDGDWLTLEVYDTGRGPVFGADSMVIGHGLVGMQERIALFGGTLRTGPRPGGGFRVYARIPLEAR